MTRNVTSFHTPHTTSISQSQGTLINGLPAAAAYGDIKRESSPHSLLRNPIPALSHENLGHHDAVHFPKIPNDSESRDNIRIITPSSGSCSCSEDDQPKPRTTSEQDPASPTETDIPRPSRVRFRPRVRITSGISRHRHHRYPIPEGRLSFSRDSSLDSSPSSSISAPLRSRSDDESNKPGWGPLGQRVAFLSYNSPRRRAKNRRRRLGEVRSPDERTSLLDSAFRAPYTDDGLIYGEYETDADREEEARIAQETDKTFGTWPRRALNPHWWWWRIEPVVFCRCLDESDSE